jgi:hypothetical protein
MILKGKRFHMVEDIMDTLNELWFHRHPSDSASKIGKGYGSSALLLKEITTKLSTNNSVIKL